MASLYTVIGSRRHGRHGVDYKWFGNRAEAETYASSLIMNSQIGRSTRLHAHTSGRKFYVVEVVAVAELPAAPVVVRRPVDADVAELHYRET